MMTSTSFASLSVLNGKSLQAKIEKGELSVFLTKGVCSFAEDVFSVGILRIRETDLQGCEVDRSLVERGDPILNTALGVATASLYLPSGLKISLIHSI